MQLGRSEAGGMQAFLFRQTNAPPCRRPRSQTLNAPRRMYRKSQGLADTTLGARGPLLGLLSARSAQNPLLVPFGALYPRRASIATKLIAATKLHLAIVA